MTFWSLTNSDSPTNQTFHQFHDLDTELDLHRLWVVSKEHLRRVWHASRKRLPFRTPGSVPHCGTCLCSNCWDQIPPNCHVFARLFTSNTPWYFLDFAYHNRKIYISHWLVVPLYIEIFWTMIYHIITFKLYYHEIFCKSCIQLEYIKRNIYQTKSELNVAAFVSIT